MSTIISAERAGIKVEQKVETATAVVLEPTLVPVAVGPCFQVVKALDSAGSPRSEAGAGVYENIKRLLRGDTFPDPRSNIDYLVFQSDETKAYTKFGGTVREFSATERFLIGNYTTDATSVRAIGSGAKSRQIKVDGGTPAPTFTTSAGAAVLTGAPDIVTGGANVTGETFNFRVDGYWDEIQTTFTGVNPVSGANIRDQINTAWRRKGFSGTVASLSGNFLRLTSPSSGDESHIKINATTSTALADVWGGAAAEGRGVAYKPKAGDAFYADGVFIGYIVSIDAADTITIDRDVIVWDGSRPGALDADRWYIIARNLATPKETDRPTPNLYKETAASAASVTGTVDLSAGAAVDNKILNVEIDGVALQVVFDGTNPLAGTAIRDAINTAYGSTLASLNANTELVLTSPTTGYPSTVEIKDGDANSLLGFTSGTLSQGISAGDLYLAPDYLRNTRTGLPLTPASSLVYVQYRALRLDVTVGAEEPALVRSSDPTELESLIGPFTTENPLGLAAKKMLDEATDLRIAAFGVDSVSSSDEGDKAAYDRALEWLGAQDVYALAPLTTDPDVHAAFAAHVDDMSNKENSKFRVVYFCPERPTRKATSTLGSGVDANSTATGEADLDADIEQLLLEAEISNPTAPTVAEGIYVVFSGDTKRYNISGATSVSGVHIKSNTTFATGENTDSFYSTTEIPATYLSKAWTLYKRGSTIANVNGYPDTNGIAEAYQNMALNYASRRSRQVVPYQCSLNDGTSVVRVKGYYLAAAAAARVCRLPAYQGKTNYRLRGFTQLFGANDYFKPSDLKIIGYNNYMFVQEPIGANNPVTTWHQATTDGTNDDTREESVTTELDCGSIILIRGLRHFIGVTPLNDNFDNLFSQALTSLLAFIINDQKIWKGATISSIARKTGSKTGIVVKIKPDLIYPFNTGEIELNIA